MPIVFLLLFIVSSVLSFVLTPKATNATASTLEDFSIPTASSSAAISVVMGERVVSNPNVVWYGDLGTVPITAGGKK